MYCRRRPDPALIKRQFAATHEFLVEKWRFDELYDAMFVRPVRVVAKWFASFDGTVLDAGDANAYLDDHSAGFLDCKDLRTWGGSAAALSARADGVESEPQVADAAAGVLHNTRAVARSSYVHPAVFDATPEEVGEAWAASRRSKWYGRGERALLNLLDDRPPLLDEFAVR